MNSFSGHRGIVAGLSLLLFCLLLSLPARGQSLSAGDIAIIGVNSDNPDAFGFVALVDIPAGEVIGFTDHGWQASGSFRANEDELFYTLSSTIPRGSVVVIDDSGGAPQFSASGDQLIAFQGSVSNPTMIYAVNFEGSGWQSDATSSNTSAIPSGLVNVQTAVAVDECDNIAYGGTTSGTKAELLSAIGDKQNWACDNASRLSFAGSFAVTDGSSNTPPEFTSAPQSAGAVAGEALSLTFVATDSDADAIEYGGSSLPSGAAIDPLSGQFSWTPEESQVGSHVFTITASDRTIAVGVNVTVTVISALEARRPVVVLMPEGIAIPVGEVGSLRILISDPQGGQVSVSVTPDASLEAFTNTGYPGETLWSLALHADDEPGIAMYTVTGTDDEGLSVSLPIYVATTGTLYEGLSGTPLLNSIKSSFTPGKTLGYDVARDTMYSSVDLRPGDVVEGIYTGFELSYSGGDASTVMYNGGINAEHSWPQSMGASEEPQRSDMHSLFPAKDNVNSTRGNNPYAEIPDAETTYWFRESERLSSIPQADIDEYSESASSRFEPRESVKGDVARAVFYFNAIYSDAANGFFFDQQRSVLAEWSLTDEPSGREIARSAKIASHQGNANPFILDPSLPSRLFGTSTHTVEPAVPGQLKLGSVYPNPASESLIFEVYGVEEQQVEATLYDSIGRRVVEAGASTGLNRLALMDLPNGAYFLVVTSDAHAIKRPVVVMR
jgi:hypothetical protein